MMQPRWHSAGVSRVIIACMATETLSFQVRVLRNRSAHFGVPVWYLLALIAI
jgi:hypothetical protein